MNYKYRIDLEYDSYVMVSSLEEAHEIYDAFGGIRIYRCEGPYDDGKVIRGNSILSKDISGSIRN